MSNVCFMDAISGRAQESNANHCVIKRFCLNLCKVSKEKNRNNITVNFRRGFNFKLFYDFLFMMSIYGIQNLKFSHDTFGILDQMQLGRKLKDLSKKKLNIFRKKIKPP